MGNKGTRMEIPKINDMCHFEFWNLSSTPSPLLMMMGGCRFRKGAIRQQNWEWPFNSAECLCMSALKKGEEIFDLNYYLINKIILL
jgi:hypothetical protein